MSHPIDYQKDLNLEQLEVVLHGDGPCLVLAGAGSGKTRTIVYRVAHLIQQGIDPRRILLLTFTNKAAREMMDRVEYLLGTSVRGLWGGTFHATSHRLLRKLSRYSGYRENFSILDADDARDFIKIAVRDLNIDTKARRFPSPAVIQSVVSYHRNAGITFAEALERKHPRFLPLGDDLEQAAKQFAERKRQANALDFDDLLTVLLEVLKQHPAVRERIQNQFQYILVDEYQDTNPIQAEIIDTIAGAHRNILVVGDDAQSIYSFRAADIRNILEFPRRYPDAKTFRLETNYRSTPQILEVANAIIGENRAQFKKVLRPVKAGAAKPEFISAPSAADEASCIADRILELRDGGVKLEGIAVLFRATHHSQSLEFELSKRDIPYDYRGGMKFFERAHIKDVLAFLRIRANPADELAWIRILSLQVGIGPAIAGRLAGLLGKSETFESCLAIPFEGQLPARVEQAIGEFFALLQKLAPIREPAEIIRLITKSRLYSEYLENEYPNWQDRLEDLDQLAAFAEKTPDMVEFLGAVSLTEDYGARRTSGETHDDERIILSTIHQAKGLEWDTVFVINLTAEDFPNRRALLEEGGIEEERRLFYVAVTRARRELILTYPITRGYDSLAFQQPSPFLEEINPDLIETKDIHESIGEQVIELDADGERKPKHQYLRNIEDLPF